MFGKKNKKTTITKVATESLAVIGLTYVACCIIDGISTYRQNKRIEKLVEAAPEIAFSAMENLKDLK